MCQSSRWLSMNVMSLSPTKILVEENEKPMINFLENEIGLDVIPVPFRQGLKKCADTARKMSFYGRYLKKKTVPHPIQVFLHIKGHSDLV